MYELERMPFWCVFCSSRSVICGLTWIPVGALTHAHTFIGHVLWCRENEQTEVTQGRLIQQSEFQPHVHTHTHTHKLLHSLLLVSASVSSSHSLLFTRSPFSQAKTFLPFATGLDHKLVVTLPPYAESLTNRGEMIHSVHDLIRFDSNYNSGFSMQFNSEHTLNRRETMGIFPPILN